ESGLDLDTGGAEHREAAPVDTRIGIGSRRDDATDARRDEGRCAPLHARFEGCVARAAARGVACCAEGEDLSVKSGAVLRETLADEHTVTRHDHGTDRRARGNASFCTSGELESPSHVARFRHVSSNALQSGDVEACYTPQEGEHNRPRLLPSGLSPS